MAFSQAIAKLSVAVTAKTSAFEKGMKRARKKLMRFTANVRRATTKVLKYGAALTAVAVGSLTYFVKQSMTSLDAVAKLSDRLGIATDKLMALHHAAKLSGVETRTFNLGLQRMIRRVAEVAAGAGEAKAALRELGLQAKELQQLPVAERLMRIADALAGVENQGDRVRLAFKLFDSEAVGLLQMFTRGSVGLREMTAEFESLGGTLTRVDLAKIEAANDSIYKLKRSLSLLVDKIAVDLAPWLAVLANRIRGLGDSSFDTTKAVGSAFEIAAMVVAQFSDAINTVQRVTVALQASVMQVLADWQKLKVAALEFKGMLPLGTLLGGNDDMATARADLEAYQTIASELAVKLQKLEDRTPAVDGMRQAFIRLRREMRDLEKSIEESTAAAPENPLGNTEDSIQETANALRQMGRDAERVFQATRTGAERFEIELAKLEKLLGADLISHDTFSRALKELEDGLADPMSSALSKMESRAQAVFEATRTGAERLKSEMKELRELFAGGLIKRDTFDRAIRDLREQFGGVSDYLGGQVGFKSERELGIRPGAVPTYGMAAITAGRDRMPNLLKDSLTAEREQVSILGQILYYAQQPLGMRP